MTVIDCTFEQREKWIARDNRELGREEGLAEGFAEGLEKALRDSISSLMSNGNKSFEEACDLLGVKDREAYRDLDVINQQEV